MYTPTAISGPSMTPEALSRLFDAFSRTSREVERSHAELKAKVLALRRELAEKDRRLEQKKRLESLGLVVAGVAHEFRNPLGSISLYLGCLEETARVLPEEPAQEAGRLLSKIETAIRHLNSVVEDMLIFTRGQPPVEDPCDLPRLIDEALLLVSSDLEKAGVRFRVDVARGLRPEEGGPAVLGDRDQVVRILVNVLKNSAQAIGLLRPAGGGRVEIAVRTAPKKWGPSRAAGRASVEVAIRDNGPGVPPDRLEKLFVPFYTDKPGGVGLGLYIVHWLMERQGGRVKLENAKGGGLRVRLLFAASAGTSSSSSDPSSSGPSVSGAVRRSAARAELAGVPEEAIEEEPSW